MMILNSEELPAGRGRLETVQSHAGMFMRHVDNKGVERKITNYDDIKKLKERPDRAPRKRRPSRIGEAVRADVTRR